MCPVWRWRWGDGGGGGGSSANRTPPLLPSLGRSAVAQRAIVGAWRDDTAGGIDAGSAYVFDFPDSDSDGVGDNADLDDDNDGYSDEQEAIDGTDPLNPFSCSQGCFSFDIDLDEELEADALTDGLLVIRHLFGFSGDALIADATSNGATRQEAEEITSYLSDAENELDIDGDGEAGALTDGLLLIRYLFGFSGDALISGAVSENAQRTTAEQIQAYISERIPAI